MFSEWGTPVIMLTIVSAVWSLAMWVTRQFSAMKQLIYQQFDKALERLESHEKYDNSRFADVNNHLWELRLDNVRRDQDKETLNRRTRTETESMWIGLNRVHCSRTSKTLTGKYTSFSNSVVVQTRSQDAPAFITTTRPHEVRFNSVPCGLGTN